MNSPSKFSWSPARSRVYSACPLKYYLSYVLGSTGWQRDASEDARTAYKIGHLTSMALEVGNLVHLSIQSMLTRRVNGIKVSADREADMACFRLKQWLDSSAKMTWQDLGFGRRQLDQHFDGRPLEPGGEEEAMLEIRACVAGFFANPIARHAMKRPDLLIPQLLDPLEYRTVDVEGVPIVSRTDAVLREPGGGGLHILDWKTGRPHASHGESAPVQELYLRSGYGVPKEWWVKTSYIYLQDMCTETLESTEDQKADLVLLAKDEFMLMQEDHQRLIDGEHPLKVMPPRPKVGLCDYCSFKRGCPYAQTKGS